VPEPGNVQFFRTPAELRKWFRGNHTRATELWVGYYKKGSGKPSICVGWIDGIRKTVDGERYAIRFTPRKKGSIWSAVNIARMNVLSAEKRVSPEGAKAFAARLENKSGIYSYEQRQAHLEEPYAGMLKKHPAAAAFFEKQPPSYRKAISWWIVSAKKEETRLVRLEKLIDVCAKGKRLL
jgi:uncharacterized protein YdeI (YjbR/CyaY-like superfamily)